MKLKRGRNRVVEKDHVVILGWTDKTLVLVCELALAMESEGGGCIVLMENETPADLIHEIVAETLSPRDLKGTRLVIRQGNPMFVTDLRRISTSEARAVVCLSKNVGDVEKADAVVMRTVLSLKGLPHRLHGHLVAEIHDVDNRQILELIGETDVETVVSHDICGRLMLMSARHPGLAVVYDTIFGFEGDEFYLKAWPALVGRSFQEIMTMFPDATPVGIKRANKQRKANRINLSCTSTEKRFGLILNPAGDTIFNEGDELIVLARDDDTYHPNTEPFTQTATAWTAPPIPQLVEKTLMCGWRRDMEDLLIVLDTEVLPGSEVHILSELEIDERNLNFAQGRFLFSCALENLIRISLTRFGSLQAASTRSEI